MFQVVRWFVVVLLCWLLVGNIPAPGQEPAKMEPHKIVATASATAYVKPDSARLTFNVSTTDAGDKSAAEANEKQVKRIKDALAALKLGKAEVEVHALPTSVSTMYTPPQQPGGPRVLQGKKAQTAVEVIVREKDLDNLRKAVAKLAEAATDNGATGQEDFNQRMFRLPRGLGGVNDEPEVVNGPTIEWQATEVGEARRTAIRTAVKEALADAEAAAPPNAKLTVVETHVGAGLTQAAASPDAAVYRMLGRMDATSDHARIPVRVEVRITCAY